MLLFPADSPEQVQVFLDQGDDKNWFAPHYIVQHVSQL